MLNNQVRIVNNVGYILVWKPDHPRADKSGAYKGYTYEHMIVAENTIGRKLRSWEVVHHLDFNKVNNAPSNLLVLSGISHAKLHGWLDGIGFSPKVRDFTYKSNSKIEKVLACCTRCKHCNLPTDNEAYCSDSCRRTQCRTKIRGEEGRLRPGKEKLLRLLAKYSWSKIGRHYGVSDNAVRRWAVGHGIDPSGFSRGKAR